MRRGRARAALMADLSSRPRFQQRVCPLLTPAFRAWWRLSRGATFAVRCLADNRENRIALRRHSTIPGWRLAGGGIKSGGTLRAAADKELAEETGLRAVVPPLLYLAFTPTTRISRTTTSPCSSSTPSKQPHFNPITKSPRWASSPPDHLPRGNTRPTQAPMAKVFENVPVSAHW